MAGRLTEERVRSDLEVLSRAGLALEDFLNEAMPAMASAVPWDAACVATNDPATLILTSGRKYGSLTCTDEEDALFMRLEYAEEESTSFRSLAVTGATSVGMGIELHGDVQRSIRMEELICPAFGFADESRMVFRDDVGVWGAFALFRGTDSASFSESEVDYLGSLSASFARGVRTGVLASLGATSIIDSTDSGPGVVIVDAKNQVLQASLGIAARLDELRAPGNTSDPMSLVHGLAEAARLVAAGSTDARMPRARVRTASGKWLALHASPLAGESGRALDVVVTIEEARPPEIIELVVAGFGLTPRERDVTQLVLQGVETKEIAAKLHLSAYTVQDHLKVVFDKAGVRSRRELISRVCLDHYLPRQGDLVGPSGWFVS